MRTGALSPNSGGSTMGGNSGASVWVRSTTRMRPATRSETRCARMGELMSSPGEFPLERLGIVEKAGDEILGDLARIDVLEAALERVDDGCGERRGRKLRRRHACVPFIVDRPGEGVDDAD